MCGSSMISFGELPPEILLKILTNLTKPDLLNVRLTCRRCCSIINTFWDQVIFQHRKSFLVTNQLSERIRKRSQRILLSFDKHRISNNWKIGRYNEENKFLPTKYIPCFQLEKDRVWLSRGCYMKGFERRGRDVNLRRPTVTLNGFSPSNVCKFVVQNDLILIGNGHNLRLYSQNDRKYVSDLNLYDMEITCVDMAFDLIAVGSRNNRLYLNHVTKTSPIFRWEEIFDDRIWSVAFNDERLAIGTAANCSSTSLIILNMEKCKTELALGTQQRGAGILNFKWETSSLLWSGGYDSVLRKWDLRIGQCVQTFPDVWMSKIYSFDYDFVNTVITGCESNGRVVLWDTRKDKYVQAYYLKSCIRSSSPVYSLSFDAEQLFAITECHMNILDFSVLDGSIQDYSNVFKVQIVV